MDNKKWLVGQSVRVGRGHILFGTKVVKVTPDGMEVELPAYWHGQLLFDNNGKEKNGFELLPVFDTQTLVVGQLVALQSACYSASGEVVKIKWTGGAVVRATSQCGLTSIGDLLHFDRNGKGRDDEGTWEGGAWYIVGLTSKEEIARSLAIMAKNSEISPLASQIANIARNKRENEEIARQLEAIINTITESVRIDTMAMNVRENKKSAPNKEESTRQLITNKEEIARQLKTIIDTIAKNILENEEIVRQLQAKARANVQHDN